MERVELWEPVQLRIRFRIQSRDMRETENLPAPLYCLLLLLSGVSSYNISSGGHPQQRPAGPSEPSLRQPHLTTLRGNKMINDQQEKP
ncbi:hypothetical protein SRHO_G00034690 [Serrasalmus rhombeus]